MITRVRQTIEGLSRKLETPAGFQTVARRRKDRDSTIRASSTFSRWITKIDERGSEARRSRGGDDNQSGRRKLATSRAIELLSRGTNSIRMRFPKSRASSVTVFTHARTQRAGSRMRRALQSRLDIDDGRSGGRLYPISPPKFAASPLCSGSVPAPMLSLRSGLRPALSEVVGLRWLTQRGRFAASFIRRHGVRGSF